ncbi:hypothetical protein [Flavobacterium terrisoli]|uniref:hypothetical protein n=1 Tax=Flavobacterium terrisoli TaxID=3242195 RepID=UPI002542A9F1|nr:hypothetical protein [Flavobacterium buctense]
MKKVIFLFVLFFSISFYGQNDKINFVVTVNGMDASNIIKMKKEQLKDAVIAYRFEDKNLSDTKVIGFIIKVPGIQAVKIVGNKIDDRTYQKILRTASKGDKITFFDIKTNKNSTSGPICNVGPVVIEIY